MRDKNQLPGTSKSNHELIIKVPENMETTLSDMLCIYNVPPSLRHINPSAYTPQVISIGPIHHDNPLLRKMEIQKLRYFDEFCKRRTINEKEEDQVQQIQKQFATDLLNQIDEDEIRHCYAYDSYDVTDSTKFLNLILLDSVFIIELFLRSIRFSDHLNDFIMGKPWLRTDVQKDLILLENQIPFSILEKLYSFAFPTGDEPQNYPSFLDLTCTYFHNFKPRRTSIENPEMILHFTDLVRYFWAHEHPEMWPGTIESLYSITKLHQAGLKLKPARGKCFLDVKFTPGRSCVMLAELELPCFEVDDTTEFVVRNLMALEQCHYPDETYICNYIRLWDLLIDTAEDVDLLVDKKIILNGLGDGSAVAGLFNNLCNQIVEVKSCYYVHAVMLNGYYKSCGNHTMATLRSVYFGDLWRGTGSVAAVVLLILTLIQTVCSIFQVKPAGKS